MNNRNKNTNKRRANNKAQAANNSVINSMQTSERKKQISLLDNENGSQNIQQNNRNQYKKENSELQNNYISFNKNNLDEIQKDKNENIDKDKINSGDRLKDATQNKKTVENSFFQETNRVLSSSTQNLNTLKNTAEFKVDDYDTLPFGDEYSNSNSNTIPNLNHSNTCSLICKIILYNIIRPIYIYLLIVCIFLCFSQYSDLPYFISIILYLIILLTSIIIEIVEVKSNDKTQTITDENTKYQTIKNGKIIPKLSKDIVPGDILILNNNQIAPCDLILIDSFDERPLYFQNVTLNGSYQCDLKLIHSNIVQRFVSIKNDFSSYFKEFLKKVNLKELENYTTNIMNKDNESRNDSEIYNDINKNIDYINFIESQKIEKYFKFLSQKNISGKIYIHKKNKDNPLFLYIYENNQSSSNNITPYELDKTNIIYCGAQLKNSIWALGIVTFTGKNIKLLRGVYNYSSSWSNYFEKRKSGFEKQINYYFYILLTILLVLSIIAGIVRMDYLDDDSYLLKTDRNRHLTSPIKNFYHTLLEYFLMMHSLIPYTIFFTLEISLLVQKIYINSDLTLYNKNQTVLKNSKLINDLGKVDLLITDKTGTLTANERVFKYCVIADKCFEYVKGNRNISKKVVNIDREAKPFTDYDMIKSSSYYKSNGKIDFHQYNGFVIKAVEDENTCIYLDRTEKIIEEFWKGIALCHDAIPVFQRNNFFNDYFLNDNNNSKPKYFSDNDDNLILVESATKQGFTFYMNELNIKKYLSILNDKANNKFFNMQKNNCEVILGEPGKNNPKLILSIKKICHLKFNSIRKSESVIVQEGDYIKLYVKGVSESILSRTTNKNCPSVAIRKCRIWIDAASQTGCRCFLLGVRVLTKNELNSFLNNLKKAYESSNYDSNEDKEIYINQIIENFESNLTLLGGMFIKERLSKGVLGTLNELKKSGIKIWIASGDKIINSYSVGIATGVTEKSNDLYVLQGKGDEIIIQTNIESFIEKNKIKSKKAIKNFLYYYKDEENEDNEEKNPLKNFIKIFDDIEQKKKTLNFYVNKFDLVVNGKAFDNIIKNEENLILFFDKAILANSITFCEFNPEQKRLLVKNFKNYIKNYKLLNSYTIMGVGDGLNDIPMLNEVDLGVGINNNSNKLTSININTFSDLKCLIMFHGINNLRRNSGIFELIIVKHFMAGFIFFLYGCHTHFSNTFVFSTVEVVIYIFILSILGPIFKGLFDIKVFYYVNDDGDEESESEYIENVDEEKMKQIQKLQFYTKIFSSEFKQLYKNKQRNMMECGTNYFPYKKYLTLKYFIFLIIKSIAFSVINFYFTFGTVKYCQTVDLDGNVIDSRKTQLFMWTNLVFIFYFENIVFTDFFTWYKFIEFGVVVLIYLIVIILNEIMNSGTLIIMRSFVLFLTFLLIIIFCTLVNYFVYVLINVFDDSILYKLRVMEDETNVFEELKEGDTQEKQLVVGQEPESLVLSKDIEEVDIDDEIINNYNYNYNYKINNVTSVKNSNGREYTASTRNRINDKQETEGISEIEYKKKVISSYDYNKTTNKVSKKDERRYIYINNNNDLFISKREMTKQKMNDGENVLRTVNYRDNLKKNEEKLKQVKETK